MPFQNRVDPFGTIFATSAHGLWMGNRGRLHNSEKQIVRNWVGKAWITCALQFNGRERVLMEPGNYTELFFLDEPTALAAGHRPCAECRRADYNRFKGAFLESQAALGVTVKAAADIDRCLHAERTGPKDIRKATKLPDGAMVEVDGAAWLKLGAGLLRWSPSGYDEYRVSPDRPVVVLTPRSSVAVLGAGYRPQLHPTATRRDPLA